MLNDWGNTNVMLILKKKEKKKKKKKKLQMYIGMLIPVQELYKIAWKILNLVVLSPCISLILMFMNCICQLMIMNCTSQFFTGDNLFL